MSSTKAEAYNLLAYFILPKYVQFDSLQNDCSLTYYSGSYVLGKTNITNSLNDTTVYFNVKISIFF